MDVDVAFGIGLIVSFLLVVYVGYVVLDDLERIRQAVERLSPPPTKDNR